MESLDMKRAVICIFLMALVTYVPRVLPLTVFRKQIKVRIYTVVPGLYALCGTGGHDLPGCVHIHRKSCFGPGRNGDGVCPELLQEGTGDGGLLCHRSRVYCGASFIGTGSFGYLRRCFACWY